MIELSLRDAHAGSGDADPAMTDRSLALLQEVLDASESGTHVDAWRAALAARLDPAVVEGHAERCQAACEEIVAKIRAEQADKQRELTSLIALVREAVATVGLENNSLQASVTESTDRFEAIARMNDIRLVKSRLAAEVQALKRVMADRQRAWETTVSDLGGQVALLEEQLLMSRTEAAIDPLTHVANRRTFDRTCREWIATARPAFVVAMFDVDGFKGINDTHGHAMGDRALVAMAQVLKSSVRNDDLVARLGGDEFAVLLSAVTLRQAESRLRSVVSTLASTSLPSGEEPIFTLTVSCGVSELSAGDTAESLMQRADEALYEAKRQGKNRVASKVRPFLRDLMRRRP
jgi:diguanylate cyclase (GGDEF)-like protein